MNMVLTPWYNNIGCTGRSVHARYEPCTSSCPTSRMIETTRLSKPPASDAVPPTPPQEMAAP
eukprot:2015552-Pyramimonas_sp.AAC.2